MENEEYHWIDDEEYSYLIDYSDCPFCGYVLGEHSPEPDECPRVISDDDADAE